MQYAVDGVFLELVVDHLDDEPEPAQLDHALEEIVPLVCSFLKEKLAERGITSLQIVWPDQGKSINCEENPIE